MNFNFRLTPPSPIRLLALSHGMVIALAAGIPLPASAAPPTMPTLPTQCSSTATCTTPSGQIITQFSNNATYNINGNQGVVSQTANKAIVNWKDFNIGVGNEVLYRRVDGQGNIVDGASFSTLNRIWQGSPSQIAGKISVQAGQKGAIYLINQNGIVFNKGAELVNVHTLVASALNIKDDVFLHPNGLYSAFDGKDKFDPAFVWEGSADQFRDTLIQIDPDVHLKAQLGGALLFVAPKVVNYGKLETDKGQTVLAGGYKVYISAPPDFGTNTKDVPKDSPYLGLAGMLVEVDPYQGNDSNGAPVHAGQVINDKLGEIIANRGNATLVALAVNQMGRVTATTSVTEKGSIRLLARAGNGCTATNSADCNERVAFVNELVLSAKTTGDLVLGQGSKTEVQAYVPTSGETEKTITDEQLFNPSTIQAVGKSIVLEDNAQMLAPGGHITLSAQAKGNVFQIPTDPANDSRVYVGHDVKIDVSGASASASVERYFKEIDLRSTELKDNPLNRNGFLRGKKVWVDLRELPDSGFADMSGYTNTIQRTVAEKLSTGGNVNLRSEGDLILRAGSVVNVSGGVVNHTGGYGQTSQVASNGVVFDLAKAKGDRVYDRIIGQYTVTDPKWGVSKTYYLPTDRQYYAAYTEGKDAGVMSYQANAYVFGGEFKGGVTIGENQRQAAPRPGALIIGDASQAGSSLANFRSPDMVLRKNVDPLYGFTPKDTLPPAFANQAQLSTDMLNRSGLGKVAVFSNGKVTLEEGSDLRLPAFGELALTAAKVDIRDSVIIPAGTISLSAQVNATTPPLQTDLTVASGVTLSTAGVWVNDSLHGVDTSRTLAQSPSVDQNGNVLPATSAKHIWDGGTITVKSTGTLTLNTNSTLDVSGSGYVSNSGKLTNGDAGTIDIGNNKDINNLPLTMNANLLAHAPGKGGTLKLKAQALTLGAQKRGVLGEYWMRPEFFAGNGFANYILEGRDSVVVRSGADIAPTVASMVLGNGYTSHASGSDIRQFSKIEVNPEYERQAVSLTLNATSTDNTLPNVGGLLVEEDATLRVDAGGALKLSATQNQLQVNGNLIAPGGTIQLTMWPDSLELGYSQQQAIWLGAKSHISAAGKVVNTPSNIRRGKVWDGGTINIDAKRGYVVAEAGAVLDVSGVAATFDLPAKVGPYLTLQPTQVVGNAGAINIKVREGALLDATIQASSPGARGGSLNLSVGPDSLQAGYPGDPFNDPTRQWKAVLSQSTNVPAVPAGLKPGDNIDLVAPGVMKFALDRALQGGVEQIAVKARDTVVLQGDINLKTAKGLRAITLDAPVIEGSGGQKVILDAAYVNLGNSNPLRQTPQTAVAGISNELLVSAQHVDVTGSFALSGFNKATIQSAGDVRFVGVLPTVNQVQPLGSFTLANDLVIKARQVYASTYSSYAVSAPGKTITIAGNGTPTPVLSAASDLKFTANQILLEGLQPGEKGGTIKAPFGRVTLDASDKVTLGDGSLVSVSGEGQTVPFGRTDQTGRIYLYGASTVGTPSEKQIVLQGDAVNFDTGAKFDVSGGGDLFAYEWIKGLGGSNDVLSPAYSPNTYAVLPGYHNGVAPTDAQFLAEKGASANAPAAGSVVYLSGGSGLAANYYTLLPVRYGLLNGAYLVKVADAKYQDMLPSQAQATLAGGAIVSGHLAALTSDGKYTQTSRTQGFVVEPNALAKSRSEYLLTNLSDYFRGKGAYQLPGDAGRVAFNAQSSLSLIGELVSKREAGYRGAEVDIAVNKLAVVSPGGAPLSASEQAEKYVLVNADALNALGAESLLLGGTRSTRADGTGVDVNVTSQKLLIANAETAQDKHALNGPEIVLAATEQVLLKSGAVIQSTGNTIDRADTLHLSNSNGDGALLRVSSGAKASVLRQPASGLQGDLIIEQGASVGATGSLTLDATRNNTLDGTITLGSGAGLALGAGLISLGDLNGAGVSQGLKYDLSAFGKLLQTTDDLSLRSYQTIDIYGPLDMLAILNGKAAPNLRLEAQGIKGVKAIAGQDANVLLAGNQVYLANPTGKSMSASGGTGTFEIRAKEIRTGDGDFTFAGFNNATLDATSQIIADGKGSINSVGDIYLKTPRVTATNGSNYRFMSSAALTLQALNGKAHALVQSVPSATLTFQGADVTIGGMVDLPGGKIAVKATNGDITLTNGGELRAAGTESMIFDAAVGQPGGEIELNASNKVNLATGSIVDVSATGADAGLLRVRANSIVTDGDLKGGAKPGAEGATGSQGRFELDVGGLAFNNTPGQNPVDEFGSLADKLVAGNFNDSVRIRVRTGDATLDTSKQVKAREIKLSADAGSISIAGTLNATHARGGSIALAAKNDLTLVGKGASGATLSADALDIGRQGGRVELAASDGYLDLQSGSSIKVDGGVGGLGGQVWLRAGVDGNNTPKVKKDANGNFNLKTSVSGADYTDANGNIYSATYLEAVQKKTYNLTKLDINTALIGTLQSGLSTFYNNLTKPNSIFRVVPGLEIVNSGGEITLSNNWNFGATGTVNANGTTLSAQAVRYGTQAEAGVLTLRASGNVNLDRSLSDGFINTSTNAPNSWVYDTAQSNTWSYRIVAGNDAAQATPSAAKAGSGNVNIAAGQVVRTGAGFIDVSAGQDINFGQSGTGSATQVGVLYTTGRNSPSLAGFNPPKSNPNRTTPVIYPTGGGDIRLAALNNINGKYYENATTEPAVNQWLFRNYQPGQVNPQTTWWSRFDKFRQGVATLGGGNISVEAKGNIDKLWLSAPTNGRLGGNAAQAADITNLKVQGGGDILVQAGGNVTDGLIFLGQGQGKMVAGDKLESRVAMQDATVQLVALNNVSVLDAFNPTAFTQSSINRTKSTSEPDGRAAYFSSYGDKATTYDRYNAAIHMLSRSGDAALKSIYSGNNGVQKANAYPGFLNAWAPLGNVNVDSQVTLFPNAVGDLNLIAGRNINLNQRLIMSDYAVKETRGITEPADDLAKMPDFVPTSILIPAQHDTDILHQNDSKHARLFAGEDVIGKEVGLPVLNLAKPAVVQAGRDVLDLWASFQNVTSSDVSQVLAGRDIRYQTKVDADGFILSSAARLEMSGPGRLEVLAGRDIDLGASGGIVSVGDAINPYLGEAGASLTVLAGMGTQGGGVRQPDYAAFKAAYLDPSIDQATGKVTPTKAIQDFEAAMQALARKQERAQLKYEAITAGVPLSESALDQLLDTTKAASVTQRTQNLLQAFYAQSPAAQARQILFNEMREAGKEFVAEGRATRGSKAASVLFPTSVNGQAVKYDGDLNLFFSQIKTERGGDIELLVPGGLLNVGLSSSGAQQKSAAELGIVTVRDGEVRAYVRDDIQVNSSRIFTLGGNDIVLWSELGNIDAGKGSKTASAAPPPKVVVKDGKVTYDVSGSVAGSGIATQDTLEGKPSGDGFLIAPKGEVNAGDAGIRTRGSLLLAALRVRGADNIQVGGASVGVPITATVDNLTALAGSSALPATADQTQSLKNAGDQGQRLKDAIDKLKNFGPSFITVEVIGFGAGGSPTP